MRSPQCGQHHPSTPNTRNRSVDQVRRRPSGAATAAAETRAGEPSSGSGFGTTSERHDAFGANTPWYSTWFARGGGTSDARRETSSAGLKTNAAVPSLHARFRRSTTCPSARRSRRDFANAGRHTYRARRSRPTRSRGPEDRPHKPTVRAKIPPYESRGPEKCPLRRAKSTRSSQRRGANDPASGSPRRRGAPLRSDGERSHYQAQRDHGLHQSHPRQGTVSPRSPSTRPAPARSGRPPRSSPIARPPRSVLRSGLSRRPRVSRLSWRP